MFKRVAHQLKANRKTETPEHFLFLDTETLPRRVDSDTEEHVLRLGAAIYWHRSRSRRRERVSPFYFYTADDFWRTLDLLIAPHTRIVMVAHNTGFDFQVLGGPDAMRRHGWLITKAIVDDPPFILKARKDGASLLLLDWYNYFRGSLSSAGLLLGVPKLPMPTYTESDPRWLSYCRNDVLVLYRALAEYVKWIEDHDLGNFAYTLAGQAFNAYRHRFMPAPIYIHTRRSAIAIERRGYFGGRVEMFSNATLPRQTYTYLDINSAYASVMRDGDYPTALRRVVARPRVEQVTEWLNDYCMMADVVLTTPTPLYPCRVEGRLLFPTGTFTTTLATPELRLAIQRGHVRSVRLCVLYSKANLFRSWVIETFAMRQHAKNSGDYFRDEMMKRLSNSLFGKFGQRNYEWKKVADEPEGSDGIWKEVHLSTGRVTTFRRLGGVKEKRTTMTEGFHSFVAIAAHVSSASRVLLLRYIEQAGWEHIFYCDTDSLIVDEAGAASLAPAVHPRELGALKVEGTSEDVALLAPKNYRFGKIERHKGRRNDATLLDDGRYQQEQFVSLVGALRMQWHGGPLVRTIRKRDALQYRKGVVLSSGRIRPIRMIDGDPDPADIRHDDRSGQHLKPVRHDKTLRRDNAHCHYNADNDYCLCDL